MKEKYIIHKAGKGGWSDWVYPVNNFKFKCCDCGLVHEMQFKSFNETNRKGKTFNVVILPETIRTMFRARRLKKQIIIR